eukprot:scaffold11044_cov32-Phaeocystis_antarctica.AAC.2
MASRVSSPAEASRVVVDDRVCRREASMLVHELAHPPAPVTAHGIGKDPRSPQPKHRRRP